MNCEAEEKLFEHLFAGYKKNMKPVSKEGSPIEVFLQYSLLELISISEVDQEMTTLGHILLAWRDEGLQWNVEKCNISFITASHVDIWMPDVVIGNGDHFFFDMDLKYSTSYRVKVNHEGQVTFQVSSQITNHCTILTTRFPFDFQSCGIQFAVWAYPTTQVTMNASQDNSITDHYKANDQWDLLNAEVKQCLQWIEGRSHAYSRLVYRFLFKRNPTYYVANLIYPCIVSSIVALFSFILPPESSSKISVSITVVLSFIFFLVSIEQHLPRSDEIPYIVIYVNLVLFLSSLSLLSSIVVLIIHHSNHQKYPPKWLSKIYCALTRKLSKPPSGWKEERNEIKEGFQKKVADLMEAWLNLREFQDGSLINPPKAAAERMKVRKSYHALESSNIRRFTENENNILKENAVRVSEIKELLKKADELSAEWQVLDNHLTWTKMMNVFNKFLFICFVFATTTSGILLIYFFPQIYNIANASANICAFTTSLKSE